jgi:hypothetical protein
MEGDYKQKHFFHKKTRDLRTKEGCHPKNYFCTFYKFSLFIALILWSFDSFKSGYLTAD